MTGCEIFLDPTLIFFYRVLGMPFANAATTDSSSAGFFLPEINECQVSFLQAHIVSAHDFFLCSTSHKSLKKWLLFC